MSHFWIGHPGPAQVDRLQWPTLHDLSLADKSARAPDDDRLVCVCCSPCIRRGDPYQQGARSSLGFIPCSELAERMQQQSMASCESLDKATGPAASLVASTRSSICSWEAGSWEIQPAEVEICLDSKRRPWQLGSGGFGQVSPRLLLYYIAHPSRSGKTMATHFAPYVARISRECSS